MSVSTVSSMQMTGQLIGMLDSPYVRRVAIALCHYNLPFEHRPLSVFRDVDAFRQINPIVKAPTFVCDNGAILMDSTLILTYLQKVVDVQNGNPDAHIHLMPTSITQYQKALYLIGLGLNACDKSVQIVYERELRPEEKQHQPWFERVQSQLLAAYDLIEKEMSNREGWLVENQMTHADIAIAVAWQFTQYMISDVVPIDRYPAISALSATAEALPAFKASPLAPGWQPKV